MWEKLTSNSPYHNIQNVQTPLLILQNEKDKLVPWNQGLTFYNALRRMGKEVILLQYKGEGHHLNKEANMLDYIQRRLDFFNHHVKGDPPADWIKEGIPHIKMNHHLHQRLKQQHPDQKNNNP